MSSIPIDWARVADLAFPPPSPYLADPVLWGNEKLKEHWWSKQREIANSVKINRRTAVPSAHGPGKSFIASRVASWWLDSHPPGSAFVATSAPTAPQVRAILWREINKAHRKGNLVGRVNQTEWLIGNELIGFGRKPADPAEGGDDETITAFQGIHAPYVLVVLDEAGGIPEALGNAADSLITNEDSRILAIGNPDDPSSHFEKVCRDGSGWTVIPISIFDTPNFTGEEVPDDLRKVLPSPVWVDEKKRDWGEGSAIYTAKVLGQFPRDATDAVVPYSWAQQCRRNEIMVNPDMNVHIGADIGAGVDETVMWSYQSRKFLEVRRSRHDDPMRAVGEIVRFVGEVRNPTLYKVIVNIDAIGVGWGVAGRVREVCQEKGWVDVEVNAINVAEASSKPDEYKNLRAELWWAVREATHDTLWDMAQVDDQTIAELTTPKWSENSSGQIEVEKRERIVARLGRSPDNASALILAPYVAPKPVMVQTTYNTVRRRR